MFIIQYLGELLAHVNLDIRLALPVTELYRLFLERHPQDKRRIEDISTKRLINAANEGARGSLYQNKTIDHEDESRLYNELEITIIKASGLPLSIDNEPPSSYVHFQLLGHPDKFTNPRPYDSNPIYNEKFVFPMITTEQQLRLLRRSQFLLSVIDMKLEECEDDSQIVGNNGIIGEISINLSELADGHAIVSDFTIKDANSVRIGEIELSMRWKNPLKHHRSLGPLALSNADVEIIMSVFASSDVNQIAVDYIAFCRYIDPSKGVTRAIDSLVMFMNKITEKENKSPSDILHVLLSEDSNISEELFINSLLKLQIDILPSDLIELYKYIDTQNTDCIQIQDILVSLRLDDTMRIPSVLYDKLLLRVKDLSSKKQYPLKFFENADSWGIQGRITRLEFKKVLHKLGFILVDEPEGNLDIIHTSKNTSSKNISKSNAVLSSTNGHDEEVLQESGVDNTQSEYYKEQRRVFEQQFADLSAQSRLIAEQLLSNKKRESLAGAVVAGTHRTLVFVYVLYIVYYIYICFKRVMILLCVYIIIIIYKYYINKYNITLNCYL